MVTIDGKNLTIQQVIAVALEGQEVQISEQAKQNITRTQQWVKEISLGEKPVYGINTGFGIFAENQITQSDIAQLNRNLILSHAVGTGTNFSKEITRAAILIRCNTLASGYSGIRLELIENMIAMLNKGLTPIIPSQGSLGSSGDLAPLSHLALVLTTDALDRESDSGWAEYQGQRMTGKAAMQAAGIPEAMLGASNAFDARLHQIRNQEGQQAVAARIRDLTAESTMLNAGGRVQDAYSFRCGPQVQGPARDTLWFVQNIVQREINAVTDNPLIFGPEEAISGGNFHGEVVGMVMDFLKIALTEVSAISERRVFQITDGKMNAGLPPMLVDHHKAAGLNSGMMMPQYTAASLVLENQHLSTPDSINSLPTSGGKEDHNANSLTAARHAAYIAQNTAHVLAVELYAACRAIDIRLKENSTFHMGKGVRQAYKILRDQIPYQPGDALWGPEIEAVREMVREAKFTLP
ncbi:MAG: aromatic amino acid lyase [Anaerolineales bacterium]